MIKTAAITIYRDRGGFLILREESEFPPFYFLLKLNKSSDRAVARFAAENRFGSCPYRAVGNVLVNNEFFIIFAVTCNCDDFVLVALVVAVMRADNDFGLTIDLFFMSRSSVGFGIHDVVGNNDH